MAAAGEMVPAPLQAARGGDLGEQHTWGGRGREGGEGEERGREGGEGGERGRGGREGREGRERRGEREGREGGTEAASTCQKQYPSQLKIDTLLVQR